MRRERTDRVCKVCKMWLVVECECGAEDPKIRLFLPEVHKSRWPKVKNACQKALITAVKLLAAAAITSPFALWSVRSAYLERGYQAYGGEWLLIILCWILCFKLLGKFLK